MDYTYTGLFKLHKKSGSSIDGFVVHDQDVIKQSIISLIKTHKGSRVYDPDYGTNLHRLVFEQNIARTRNIARTEVKHVITKYEPRAEIKELSVFPNDQNPNEVILVLTVIYIEFGIEDIIEITVQADTTWENEEKANMV